MLKLLASKRPRENQIVTKGFPCSLSLHATPAKGGRVGRGGGVEDWVTPKGRSDEGVPPGSLRPFIIRRYSRGKLTRVAVNQPPSC